MYRLIISFILLLGTISCTTYSIPRYHTVSSYLSSIDKDYLSSIDEDCINIFEEIEIKWIKKDSTLCYHFNQDLLLDIMNSQKCFTRMDTSKIIDLFGKPNYNDYRKKELIYILSPDCQVEVQSIIANPFTMIIQYSQGKVERIKYHITPWYN